MSGGVDSSVTAALLRDAGHEVIGMTMRLYDASRDERRGRGGSCCSPAEVDLARRVCSQLKIPHYVVDESRRFAEKVIEPFARDYAAGRTPNPCTRCNQSIKFEPLLRRARALGAEALATGHYARIENGRLLRGSDPDKDQSYFLFAMGSEALANVWFPLGSWDKAAVREKAQALGLPNADAPDSQELCFVPGGDHAAVVEERLRAAGGNLDALAPGPVVDLDGNVVGDHDGIHRVTVGQRRGFRSKGTERRYVLRVIPPTRTIVVGAAESARAHRCQVGELQRIHPLRAGDAVRLLVQVRHKSAAVAATVHAADRCAAVVFDEPAAAVAPGQAAVFYQGDEVVGGGWITETDPLPA
jgi:tRNA-specific 2-thiouridylase